MNEQHYYPPANDTAKPESIRLEIDLAGNLSVDGQRTGVHFTRTEAKVVRAIMGSVAVTTPDFLLSYIYGGRDEPLAKIFCIFVCKVRKKLGAHARAIETVWGRGWVRNRAYVLAPELLSTIDVPIEADLLDQLMLHTALRAEDCVALAVREVIARLEAQ